MIWGASPTASAYGKMSMKDLCARARLTGEPLARCWSPCPSSGQPVARYSRRVAGRQAGGDAVTKGRHKAGCKDETLPAVTRDSQRDRKMAPSQAAHRAATCRNRSGYPPLTFTHFSSSLSFDVSWPLFVEDGWLL